MFEVTYEQVADVLHKYDWRILVRVCQTLADAATEYTRWATVRPDLPWVYEKAWEYQQAASILLQAIQES